MTDLGRRPTRVLLLMGLDHERLTYRSAGRDFRLTDEREILA